MPRATNRRKASDSRAQSRSQDGAPNHPFQKRRGRAAVAEENEDEAQNEDDEMEDAASDDGAKTVERKAIDLVRLALFTEYRRTSLKRDEIAKKIFGGRANKGDFQPVFDRAQHTLRKTFGMELHEIMSRAERDRADATRDGARGQDDLNNMAEAKKKSTVASSKQYILRSVLDDTIIEAASLYDAEIEDAERTELALWHPNDEESRPDGALLACKHTNADQLGLIGILHIILALILVNGRVLTDMQLRSYLKRLRLPTGSAVSSNNTSQAVKPLTIDAYLTQLVKQSYLDKQKTSLGSTQGGGGQKRARGGGEDGDATFEWKWGSRAIAEIGEEGVGAFVVDFMESVEKERESMAAEEEGRRGNSRREREQMEKRKEKLVKGIGRAAGGGLVPFK